MKKSTTKSTKSPAPVTKAALPIAKTTTKTAVTKKPTSAPPFVVKPVAPKRLVTTVTALIDVGFGNTLFVRGDGPGLSWEKGVPLDSMGNDKWAITFPESARPVVFKFLLNDVSWSTGEDYTAAPGTSITLTPVF